MPHTSILQIVECKLISLHKSRILEILHQGGAIEPEDVRRLPSDLDLPLLIVMHFKPGGLLDKLVPKLATGGHGTGSSNKGQAAILNCVMVKLAALTSSLSAGILHPDGNEGIIYNLRVARAYLGKALIQTQGAKKRTSDIEVK